MTIKRIVWHGLGPLILVFLVSACADWPAIEGIFGGRQDEKDMPAQKQKQVVNAQVEQTKENKNTPSEKGKQAAKVTATQEQTAGWVLQCGHSNKRCYIQQHIFAPESSMVFVGVSVGYLGPNEQPRFLFSLPLGVLLAPGMAFDIDRGHKTKLPIRVCISDGCKADMPLGEALLTRLKQGKQMNVFFADAATEKTIKVDLSLQGFTRAYTKLAARR